MQCRIGQREKLDCDIVTTKPKPTLWVALKLGWPFRGFQVEARGLDLHILTNDQSLDKDGPL